MTTKNLLGSFLHKIKTDRIFIAGVLSAVISIGGLTAYLIFEKDQAALKHNIDNLLYACIGLAIATLGINVTVSFLKGKESGWNKYSSEDSYYKIKLGREMDAKLQAQITEITTSEAILNALYDKTVKTVESTITENLELRYGKDIKDEYNAKQIDIFLSPLEVNLERYIDRLQRNSIVNLVIGILGTAAALIILSDTVLSPHEYLTSFSFLTHFLPRLSFVILIQIFAYFFLKLYKSNLEDSKYFQNELTNINSKIAAIKISKILDRGTNIDKLLINLSGVERNFRLTKGETLPSLEKAKIDKDEDLELLSALKDLLKNSKK